MVPSIFLARPVIRRYGARNLPIHCWLMMRVCPAKDQDCVGVRRNLVHFKNKLMRLRCVTRLTQIKASILLFSHRPSILTVVKY